MEKMRKMTRIFLFMIAFIVAAGIVAVPEEVSAASFTSKRVSNVKVTKKTYNSVKLEWKKVSGAQKYQVYRATSKNGKYKRIVTTSKNYVTNTKLTTGKNYYYKVRAYKTSNGKKRYTKYSYKIKTYPKLETPSAKTTLSSNRNKVYWNSVKGAQKYQVYRAVKGGSYQKVATTTNRYYIDKNTTVARTYYYKVRAVRKVKFSNKYSSYSSAKTSATKMSTPALTVSSFESGINLKWSAVSGATGYQVYRATNGGTFSKVATIKGTTYNNTGVEAGRDYIYKVRAYKTIDGTTKYSNFSSMVSGQKYLAAPKLAVTSGNGKIELSWSKVPNATGYQIYRYGDDGIAEYLGSVNSASYSDGTVDMYKDYTYKVKAYRDIDSRTNYGSESEKITAQLVLCAPAVEIDSIGMDSVSVKWNKSYNASKYKISWTNEAGEQQHQWINTNGDGNNDYFAYTIKSLETGKPYTIDVTANYYREDIQKEEYAASAPVTATPQLQAPVIKVTDVEYDKIAISWDEVVDATSYEVTMTVEGEEPIVASTEEKTITMAGLEEGIEHKFTVTAVADNGTKSVASNEVSAITVPKPTTEITAKPKKNSIVLSWEAAYGGASYNIYQKKGSSYEYIANSADRTYEVTGLAEETSYSFKIETVTTLGTKSALSKAVTAVTIDPYTTFMEKEDCYLQYNTQKIWIGQTWTDTVNAGLNAAAGGSGKISYTVKRIRTGKEVYLYCYDTVDFDEFLIVYVYDGKIAGWMTNRDNAGSFEGTPILTNEPSSNYASLGDTKGLYLLVNTYDERFENLDSLGYNTEFAVGDAVFAGIQFFSPVGNAIPTSYKQEEQVAMYMVNAYRAAHGLYILDYNSDLYGEEDGVGTLAYAKTMAQSGKMSHYASELKTGPLAGTNMNNRAILLSEVTDPEQVITSENAAVNSSVGEILAQRWYTGTVYHKNAMLMHEPSYQNYTEPKYMAVASYENGSDIYWAFQTSAVAK